MMPTSNETVQERRRHWAHMPDSYTKYHRGAESRIQPAGDHQPKYSFFGQGLLLVMEERPDVSWTINEVEASDTVASVDDTTEVLSEFFGISPQDLDAIYDAQQVQDHHRRQLGDMVMAAPLYPASRGS